MKRILAVSSLIAVVFSGSTAGARYYDASTARFLEEDPLIVGEPSRPQSLNRFVYVENRPTKLTDPLGLYGFGFGFGETTEVGIVKGYAQTGAVGAGVFWPGLLPLRGFNTGAFATWGGFSSAPNNACPAASSPPWAVGGFGGGGFNFFLTNAANVNQLKDKFRSINLNFGLGIRAASLQYAYDDKGTWILTYGGPIPGVGMPTGGGLGGSVSSYDTWTWTTK